MRRYARKQRGGDCRQRRCSYRKSRKYIVLAGLTEFFGLERIQRPRLILSRLHCRSHPLKNIVGIVPTSIDCATNGALAACLLRSFLLALGPRSSPSVDSDCLVIRLCSLRLPDVPSRWMAMCPARELHRTGSTASRRSVRSSH